MSNISKKTYKELAEKFFEEVFIEVDRILKELGIEFYLIGSYAKNYHLLEKNIKPNRETRDIDFAVMLPDIIEYENMISRFLYKEFKKAGEPYRIMHIRTGAIIDLLPFGKIAEEYTVKFTERKIELSVIGLNEVKAGAIDAQIGRVNVKVSPLEGLVILKLISFSEKPLEREKDLDDINEILRNYFDMNYERFYSDNLDLADEIGTNYFTDLVGARLLGRDIKHIIKQSNVLSDKIISIIENELKEKHGSIIEYFLRKNYMKNYELIKNIFIQILKGIKE